MLKPASKYELRSREIQDIMRSPPKRLFAWGNSIFLGMLVLSILFARAIQLPVKVILPCKIVKVVFEPAHRRCMLNLAMLTILNNHIRTGQSAIVRLDDLVVPRLGELRGTIMDVNIVTNTLVYCMAGDVTNTVVTETGKKVTLMDGMLGTIKVKVGMTSVLLLLSDKIASSNVPVKPFTPMASMAPVLSN